MFSDERCRENQNTFYVQKRFLNSTIYDIMWKNVVEPDRPQVTQWRMRVAWYIPKATSTHSEYAVLIAFPLQQWLH
jgi:hypothetical protein